MKILQGLRSILVTRMKLVAFLSFAFFGTVFCVATALDVFDPHRLVNAPSFPITGPLSYGYFGLFLYIFFFNLAVSALAVITLPGFAFFPLAPATLIFRGYIWGTLLHFQPSWMLLLALPTLILEGLAYVFAASAGLIVGSSWICPKWMSKDAITRFQTFKKGLRESAYLYVPIVLIFLTAAAVETLTMRAISG